MRKGVAVPLDLFTDSSNAKGGGHREARVRVRRGQASFRRALLKRYGSVCACTGPAPEQVLEAGHLYSYAEIGKHHDHGGLLFRRDIHRLFDTGHLAVNPATSRLHLDPSIANYPAYKMLGGENLYVDLTPQHRDWLERHWGRFRE